VRSLTLALAAAALVVGLAPLPIARALPASAPAASGPADFAPATQFVEIDGRFVKVEVSLSRYIPGAPIEPIFPTTTVAVNLSINDGGQLPEGLDAVGVRFEKLRGVKRFFFTPVESALIADPGPEVDAAGFVGDLSDHPSVQFLRVVVRLERDGEVIKVPMGVMRVNLIPLP
jgi:hypothetical protein